MTRYVYKLATDGGKFVTVGTVTEQEKERIQSSPVKSGTVRMFGRMS